MGIKNPLTAPKIENAIWQMERMCHGVGEPYNTMLDQVSQECFDEVFRLMKCLKPYFPSGAKGLWVKAERGSIEDFGNLEEALDCGEVESEEEFRVLWQCEFPDEIKWYQLIVYDDEKTGFRSISLGKKRIYYWVDGGKDNYETLEVQPFAEWLLESVRGCIQELEDGAYNDRIERELPARHRTGTISRKDYWDIFPSSREEFFRDLSKEEVDEFVEYMSEQTEDLLSYSETSEGMTANRFYKLCALGYKANNYSGTERTAKEQYLLHADGRDEGLRDIDPDSEEAFADWMQNREMGGHPWEVCRGGNSTHISLYVSTNDYKHYSLILAGSAWTRTVETVKFYLALRHAGELVFLQEGNLLADRLLEKEKIGIVPDEVFPAYCQGMFPDEKVIDFINLPYEEEEAVAVHVVWQPICPVELA